jgi:hypothetical protein
MKKHLLSALLAPALLMMSCATNDDLPTSPSYDSAADLAGLQAYAAVGNSLTAGYQSGAWGNPEHIANSYPNLIARQLGISNFKQVSMTGGGLTFLDTDGDGTPDTPAGNMTVNFDETGSPVLGYTQFEAAAGIFADPSPYVATDLTAPRNFGIPGITLAYAYGATLDQYYAGGLGNPYAGFYLPAGAGMSQVAAAASSGANFITCWLGNNDVLGYVTSGGTGTITDAATFEAVLGGTAMALGAAEYLVMYNVPSVTSIPYVTYPNGTIRAMLAAAGMDPVLMAMDDDLGMAVPVDISAGSGNYVLLPALTAMAANPMLGSPMAPLPDSMVLDAAELAMAEEAVATFNALIAGTVDAFNAMGRSKDILLVDANAFFDDVVANGYHTFGSTFTTEFVSGGIFSLDGVHPTSLGYAIVANETIATMNAGWGFDIMPVDMTEFMGDANGLGSVGSDVVVPDLGGMIEMFNR